MQTKVHRPKAGERKIHCRNEFELCYLRHKYLRRVTYNPTPEEMKPFMEIATRLAKNTHFVYRNLFYLVGLEQEDIINIAKVHLVSFLGLYAIENLKDKYKEFVKTFIRVQEKAPEAADIQDKNQAIFTLFLKQRMEDVVRVCRQKARNIKGLPTEECYYYCGPNKPPKVLRELVKNYEKLGFKKLDTAVYKSIKKKAGTVYGSTFRFNGNYYIAVPLDKKRLSIEDLSGANMNPHDNLHNMNPEEVYLASEEENLWEKRQEEFQEKPDSVKAGIIKKFIRKYRSKPMYKEEVKTAKRILKGLE